MSIHLAGRARRVGDDVNTDYIISSTRKRETVDPDRLKLHLLEAVDPGFAASVRHGDILVAGSNFGCGSAMEVAVTVVLSAGIRAVLAVSFARAYFRNAINNGLLPVVCDTSGIEEGDRLSVSLHEEAIRVENATKSNTLSGDPLPRFMFDIVTAGGLVSFLRRGGELRT